MAWGLGRPETLVRYGVEPDATGVYPGLRRFRDLDGQTRVGITCALCHTAVEGGVTVANARSLGGVTTATRSLAAAGAW